MSVEQIILGIMLYAAFWACCLGLSHRQYFDSNTVDWDSKYKVLWNLSLIPLGVPFLVFTTFFMIIRWWKDLPDYSENPELYTDDDDY